MTVDSVTSFHPVRLALHFVVFLLAQASAATFPGSLGTT